LLDFQNNIEYFRSKDINLMAASADTLEHAKDTAKLYRLSFTVGYGLDPGEVSARTGAFFDRDDGYLHATGYIVDPGAKVFNGVYSTRSIGRLTAKDCIGLIDYSSR
jgi:peroxiredoxin